MPMRKQMGVVAVNEGIESGRARNLRGMWCADSAAACHSSPGSPATLLLSIASQIRNLWLGSLESRETLGTSQWGMQTLSFCFRLNLLKFWVRPKDHRKRIQLTDVPRSWWHHSQIYVTFWDIGKYKKKLILRFWVGIPRFFQSPKYLRLFFYTYVGLKSS